MFMCARPLLVFGLLLVHPVIGASPQGSQSAPLNVFVTVVTDTQQRVADLTQSDFEIQPSRCGQIRAHEEARGQAPPVISTIHPCGGRHAGYRSGVDN